MKKRIFTLLLVLCMVTTLLPGAAFAAKGADDLAYAVTGGNIYFNAATGTITGHGGNITQLIIPSKIDGVSVTSIGSDAFRDCSSLTSVTISEGATSIDGEAFRNCRNLTSVTLPDSMTSIAIAAFKDCRSLTSVTIPNSVTFIGEYAFKDCSSLTNVTLPDSMTSIAMEAFSGCSSLTSVTIPDGVTDIESAAFSRCSSLTSVTIPNSVTDIGYSAFSSCSSLTSVTIPDGVTLIGDSTFAGCSSLTSVMLPDSVTDIFNSAFWGCSSLTSVMIPDSVTGIGNSAFAGCSSLTSVTIPDSVTNIGNQAFAGCSSLTSVTIPNSVTFIGYSAFGSCSGLTHFEVSAENRNYCSIDGVLFSKDKKTLISVPGGKQGLYQIPDSVTRIDEFAFSGCSSLTGVMIPDSVTDIGYDAFWGCSSLTDVYYTGSESAWKTIEIASENEALTNATIHYNSSYPVCGFFDMPAQSNWAFDGIKYCVDNNLMAGMTDTTFEPDGTLTRGQLVAILWRQAGEPAPQSANPFTDLTMNYYKDAISWAAENGIVYGRDSTHFDPNSPITRQELTAIFHRYVGEFLKQDVSGAADITGFPDYNQVSNFAKDAMAWAKGVALITGNKIDGVVYLDPRGNATRAQAATMFMNLCETVLQ